MDTQIIAQRIKDIRLAKGLTQDTLGVRAGLTRSYISLLEAGKKVPAISTLYKLSNVLGVNIGFLISGAVVVENVFSIPGLGSLMVTSIISRDYPVIVALTLVFAVIVIFVNLLVDLSYAILDPRIRL